METQAHYTRVGFFVITGLISTIVFALWLSQTSFYQKQTLYDIFFKGRITGLKEGSVVEFRGVPIGSVKDIHINSDNRIHVSVSIDSSIHLKQDAVASLETQGLTGISHIQIEGSTKNSPPIKILEGNKRPIIPSKSSLLEEVTNTLPKLLGEVSAVAKELRTFLNDENRKAFTNILHNIDQVSQFFVPEKGDKEAFFKQLHTTMDNIDATLKEFKMASSEIKKTGQEFQFILKDNRNSIPTGLNSFNKFLVEGQETLSSLRRVTDSLEESPKQFFFHDSSKGVPTR